LIIKKVAIGNFGKFKDYTMNIKDGMNIIYGCNETGKTTLQTFIKVMLYGMNSQKKAIRENDRKRFIPWNSDYANGELLITDDNGVDYLIKRKFGTSKREDTLQVINMSTGEEMAEGKWQCPGQALLDIGEEAFEKTLYIKQLGSTVMRDKEDEIMKRLINLKQTGDEDVSYYKATKKLSDAKWKLTNNRRKGKIDLLHEEIINLKEERIKLQILHDKNTEDQIELNSVIKKRDGLQKEINELEEKRTYIRKYRLFKEYQQQKEYKKELHKLSEQIKVIEGTLSYGDNSIDKDFIEEATDLRSKRDGLLLRKTELEKRCKELTKEYNENLSSDNTNYDNDLIELNNKNETIKKKNRNLKTIFIGGIIAETALLLLGFLLKDLFLWSVSIFGVFLIIYILIKLKGLKSELSTIGVEISKLQKEAQDGEQKSQTLKAVILIEKEKNENESQQVIRELVEIEDKIIGILKVIGKQDLELSRFDEHIKLLKNKVDEKQDITNKYNALQSAYEVLLKGKTLISAEKELEGFKPNDFEYEDKIEDIEKEIKDKTEVYIKVENRIKDIEINIKNRFYQKQSPADVEREIEQKKEELSYFGEVLNSINISELVLEEAFLELQKSFGTKLNAETGEILSVVTLNKYSEIKISEDYGIKVSPLEDVPVVDIDYFSNGTWDQVYFSLRMGIINLIFNDRQIPLLLDDAFLQYDDERLETTLKYLYEYSKKNQVIMFSCQKRETELYSAKDVSTFAIEKS
jgi:uncharacterized protein YhaN